MVALGAILALVPLALVVPALALLAAVSTVLVALAARDTRVARAVSRTR